MYAKWNEKSLENYDNKVRAIFEELAKHPETATIHFGTCNSKTKMIDEGTSAGLAGTCDESCKGDCREGCYAITHIDGVYTTTRQNHAENTIMRRRDATQYYDRFFRMAQTKGKNLRVNETGDFERESDVYALIETAKKYPEVKVIGYTKRVNLLKAVSELNKLPNVTIHYSLACHGIKTFADIWKVPTTSITFDKAKCTCPFQVAKMNGGKVKWSCNQCAENGCGCFSKKDVFFLAH